MLDDLFPSFSYLAETQIDETSNFETGKGNYLTVGIIMEVWSRSPTKDLDKEMEPREGRTNFWSSLG